MERNSSDVKNENRPARKPAGAAVLQDSVTAAIHRALFEEWAETGYAALRMERIAVRAKVGKAALYRRSKSKLELVTEAIRSTATNITPILDSGSFEGDIEAFIRRLAATLRHPIVRRILPDLHAENARSDELSDLLDRVTQDRRTQAMIMIDRAVERGEVHETVDRNLILDLLIAPLYWRSVVRQTRVTSADISTLVQLVASFAKD